MIKILGLDPDGARVFPDLDDTAVADELVGALGTMGPQIARLASGRTFGLGFAEILPVTIDRADPRAAGWGYVVAKDDPDRDAIVATIAPLAARRGGDGAPIVFDAADPGDWTRWLDEHLFSLVLEGKTAPHYLLLVGGPARLPFRLQSLLSSVAAVGRLDLELPALQAYVDKLVRVETAAAPTATRSAIVFGPDDRPPTDQSSALLVKPLAALVRDELRFATVALHGGDATKAKLVEACAGAPALVFTASHGVAGMGRDDAEQRRLNGAICCQRPPGVRDWVFAATDVAPDDRPFLDGAVFFQFACFGYGTPAESDYRHWLGAFPETLSGADFSAALPLRLLAHPRGPIAFVGHLDTALLQGLTGAGDASTASGWGKRTAPFVAAVRALLAAVPVGEAMTAMSDKFAITSAMIATFYDQIRRGRPVTDPMKQTFLDTWLVRNDAQNYLIHGDPAARLRIPG